MDVHNAIRLVALPVDRALPPEFSDFPGYPGVIEENLRIEGVALPVFIRFLWWRVHGEISS